MKKPRLKPQSVTYLKEYLTKKRNRPLLKTKVNPIQKLIRIKQQENKKLATQIINNPLGKLALHFTILKEKVNPVTIGNRTTYELDTSKLGAIFLLNIFKIVQLSETKDKGYLLDEYAR